MGEKKKTVDCLSWHDIIFSPDLTFILAYIFSLSYAEKGRVVGSGDTLSCLCLPLAGIFIVKRIGERERCVGIGDYDGMEKYISIVQTLITRRHKMGVGIGLKR